jgi:hypothetical protein
MLEFQRRHCILSPLIEQGAASRFELTSSCVSDLFSYAQNLWITLCMNPDHGGCKPSREAVLSLPLKKYAEKYLLKTMRCCKLLFFAKAGHPGSGDFTGVVD